MSTEYLHDRKDFPELLEAVSNNLNIDPYLIEKDYWIMHVLYGLKQQGFEFELKGGTSLSKGYGIIDRFSEDIDIHIKPPGAMNVEENPRKTSKNQIKSRRDYYEWLANNIKVAGIVSVERDETFDDTDYYRSGGIRLIYNSVTNKVSGVKEGILLEAGFDTVTPNNTLSISSWAFDTAAAVEGIDVIDNRAIDIACYHPGYTLVEKLQTIATKFRQEQTDGKLRQNLMRQYYDVYCLLDHGDVKEFIGTEGYLKHKKDRFPKADFEIPIATNEAFLLSSDILRDEYKKRYETTAALYYKGQPKFDDLLERVALFADKL